MNRFIIICVIVLMAAPVVAFAQAGSTGGTVGDQAGSTGGTIGKVDKEASGSEVRVPPHARRAHVARKHRVAVREQPAPRVRNHRVSRAAVGRREAKVFATRSTRCPNVVGVWNSWASGLFGQADTTFYKNGTWRHKSGQFGKWWCEGGELRFQHLEAGSGHGVDRQIVSADGRSITWPNGFVLFSR